MICPKCGFEQPESPECMRCGVIVARYKGPVAAVAAQATAFAPAAAGASGHETVRMVLPPPAAAPAMADSIFKEPPSFREPAPEPVAGSGTLYEGPPPAAGSTVYQGPPPGSPAVMTAGRTTFSPVFVVTRKLGVGDVLNESFTIYLRNIIPFVLLTAIAYSPVYFSSAFLTKQFAESHKAAALEATFWMGALTLLLCIPLSTAGITYGVFQQMRGRETSLGTCLSVGFSNIGRVIAVAFLQSFFAVGAAFLTLLPVLFLIGGAMSGGTRSSTALGLVLAPLVLIACIPPILLWLKYFIAIPAAIEERPSAMDALRRSAFLTAGQRGPIFRISFVLGILNLGAQVLAKMVPVAGPVIEPIGNLFLVGLSSTTCAVIYYRLRSFHESIDVDQIASVFA